MSAVIIDMDSFRRVFGETPEEMASNRVAEEIRHRVTATVLAQACARAARNVRNGHGVDAAVKMARVWALASVHPDPTEVA